jgi:hypothetical protein
MNAVSPTLLDQWIAFEIVQRDTGETTSGDPEDTKEQLSNMVKQWQR